MAQTLCRLRVTQSSTRPYRLVGGGHKTPGVLSSVVRASTFDRNLQGLWRTSHGPGPRLVFGEGWELKGAWAVRPGPWRPSCCALRRARESWSLEPNTWPWHWASGTSKVWKTTRPCNPVLWPLPFFRSWRWGCLTTDFSEVKPPKLAKPANMNYSRHSPCNRVKAGTPLRREGLGREGLHGWVVDREHALQSLLFAIVCVGQQILIIMTCYVKTPVYVIKAVSSHQIYKKHMINSNLI